MSDPNKKLTLSVVLPVYNEESSVAGLLRRVAESPCVNEMIIIDDCSTDNSVSVVQQTIESLRSAYPEIKAAQRWRGWGRSVEAQHRRGSRG